MEIKKELEKYLIMNCKGKSIAIVGNGDIKKEYGDEIDSHDHVIRFNDFKITNFKDIVGEKITIWCNRSSNWTNTRKLEWCINSRNVSEEHYKLKIKTIEPEHDFHEELKKMYETKYTITTGILLLYILEKLQIKSDVYGFNFLKSKNYYRPRKYEYKTHNSELEEKIFNTFNYVLNRGC